MNGLVLMVLALAGPVSADTPDFCVFPYRCPTAARISPQVGQRGTEVTLLLQGARLQQIEDVLFYGTGLRYVGFRPATEVPDDISQENKETPDGTEAEITFFVENDCRLGEHFFRVRTRDQLSEMLSFWVTPYPCVAEAHLGHDREGNSNGKPDSAQQVDLGTTVFGYHPKNSTIDHDYYSVELQKGQRLTVEVWSSCLGFQHFRALSDIAVTVYGPDQKKLAFVDDTSLRDMDPILSLIAPGSGKYFVDIHQNMDFEGILRHYVVHFSDSRRPTLTYPLGGKAGTTLDATTIGDLEGPAPVKIRLPDRPGVFEKSIIDHFTGGAVIPNSIQVAEFPNVLEEAADHSTPEQAQIYRGELPIALNGRIEREGETDWYRFSARKGKRYRVRTYAATMGSSLDAKIHLRPAEGNSSRLDLKADDSNWIDHDWWGNDKIWRIKDRMDPVVVFEPDTDGDYLLGVSDAQRLFGPEYVYRVEFQPLENHAFVYFPTDYREAPNKRDRLVVPRGNTIEHTFAVIHATGNRYRGGMRIVAKGLPPGVSFDCPPLKPGQTLTQATLSSSPDAAPWSGLIDLNLVPTESGSDFTGSYVQNIPSTQRRGGHNVVFNRTRRCALAVVEEAPIRVTVVQPKIGLAQNAMIDLEVKIERRPPFEGAVRVYAAWTPPGVEVPPPLVIPPGQNNGIYRLRASGNVEPDDYPFTITAQEEEGGERTWGTGYHFVASPTVRLNVVKPYVDIQLARTAIERQTVGEIRATIKTIQPLPGAAVATLVRLPKGVELIKKVTIQPGDDTVTFPVKVSQDCLIGQYKEIGCEIMIRDRGQTITQQTGNGTLRIDAERK